MATTVQNIIDRAGQRSNLNDTSLIGTTQLIAYVSTLEQLVYLTAARGNPDYFGKEANTSARAYGATWDLSTTGIAALSRVEVAAITGAVSGLSVGTEVNLVSIRQPGVALSPRVYVRSRVLREYNSELSTDASNFVTTLKLFYSHLPARRTATTDTLDLPDEWDGLLVLPLAKIMSLRDQRPEEIPSLESEWLVYWQTFLSALSVYDEGTIRELEGIMASYHRADIPQAAENG